jgi:hypothetical protein
MLRFKYNSIIKNNGRKRKMKKKILIGSIIAVSLLTLVSFSSVVGYNSVKNTQEENIQYDHIRKISNDLKIKLDKVITKQEALVLVDKAIVELNEHGLLPKGMSEKQAHRLVTRCFSKSDSLQFIQSKNDNETGNTNCLVIGFANETFFRPFPTIYDIPIVRYLVFNTSFFDDFFNFILWFYAIRSVQPVKLGPYAWVGSRYKLVENGNVTYENIDASSGWVWTLGTNGVRKWNGTFYGGINTRYQKSVINNNSYAEAWDPVGIRGFFGINLFSSITFFMGNYVPTFYIGFAREINFTYSPPWT